VAQGFSAQAQVPNFTLAKTFLNMETVFIPRVMKFATAEVAQFFADFLTNQVANQSEVPS
jgi:hypothetical protein